MKKIILTLITLAISLPAQADTYELVKKFKGTFQPIAISDNNQLLLQDEAESLAIAQLSSDEITPLPEKLRGGQLLDRINKKGKFLIEKNKRLYLVNKNARVKKLHRFKNDYSMGASILQNNNIATYDQHELTVYSRGGRQLRKISLSELFPESSECSAEAIKYTYLRVEGSSNNRVLLRLTSSEYCDSSNSKIYDTNNGTVETIAKVLHSGIFNENSFLKVSYSNEFNETLLEKFDIRSNQRLKINSLDLKNYFVQFNALDYPRLKIGRGWVTEDIEPHCLVQNSTGLNPSGVVGTNRNGLMIIQTKDESLPLDSSGYSESKNYIFRLTKKAQDVKNEFCPIIEVGTPACEISDNGTPDDYYDDRYYCSVDFTAKTPANEPLYSTGIIYNNLYGGNDTTFRNNSDGTAHVEYQYQVGTDGCGPVIDFPYNHSKYRSTLVLYFDACGV